MATTVTIENTQINDLRNTKDFKIMTFSGYKRSEVRSSFLSALVNLRIEPACNWCAELVASGHFSDIWEILIQYMGKYIQIANPKMAAYLHKKYTDYRTILSDELFHNEIELRNIASIRELFAEIICLFSVSPTRPSMQAIKLNRDDEFGKMRVDLFVAPHAQFAEAVFKETDPTELWPAVNELIYHLTCDQPNIMKSMYWIEWIIEFNIICRTNSTKKKNAKDQVVYDLDYEDDEENDGIGNNINNQESVKIERRFDIPVLPKYQTDPIWLIWDTLTYIARKSPYNARIIQSLLHLFCIDYTLSTSKRRKYLLYFAVFLICEKADQSIPLFTMTSEWLRAHVTPIHLFYKTIKRNETSNNTNYLFGN